MYLNIQMVPHTILMPCLNPNITYLFLSTGVDIAAISLSKSSIDSCDLISYNYIIFLFILDMRTQAYSFYICYHFSELIYRRY